MQLLTLMSRSRLFTSEERLKAACVGVCWKQPLLTSVFPSTVETLKRGEEEVATVKSWMGSSIYAKEIMVYIFTHLKFHCVNVMRQANAHISASHTEQGLSSKAFQ